MTRKVRSHRRSKEMEPKGNAEYNEQTQQHVCLNEKELQEFRTKQCSLYVKGMCADSTRCSMSHSETWPRRNPTLFTYEYKLCPNIQFFRTENKMQLYGKCHYGRRCRYSHSKEEQLYHPDLYKTRMCLNHPNCNGYYCPFAHSPGEMRNRCESGSETHKDRQPKPYKQDLYASSPVRKEESFKLDETCYEAVEPQMHNMPTQNITDDITSLYDKEYNTMDHNLEINSLNSTVYSPNMMATRETLVGSDFDFETLEQTVTLEGDEGNDMDMFNSYVEHESGVKNNNDDDDEEQTLALAVETRYKQEEYAFTEQRTRHAVDDEEEEEEDGWFDVVIQAGLQLLSEDHTQPPSTRKADETPVCKDCEERSDLCHLHNRMAQSWWM